MEHVRSARRPRTVQGNFIRTAVINGLYFIGGVLISRGAVAIVEEWDGDVWSLAQSYDASAGRSEKDSAQLKLWDA